MKTEEAVDEGGGLLIARVDAVVNNRLVVPSIYTFAGISYENPRQLADEFSKIKKAHQVVKFANRFGFLGIPMIVYEKCIGEPIDAWLFMAQAVRSAKKLIESVRDKIEVSETKRAILLSGLPHGSNKKNIWRLDGPYLDAALLRNARAESDKTYLNHYPQMLINEWIQETVTTTYDYVSRRCWAVPKNLAGVIWLGLADQMSRSNVNLRECAGCRKLFVPDRPNQKYCPRTRDRCRKMSQRSVKHATPESSQLPNPASDPTAKTTR